MYSTTAPRRKAASPRIRKGARKNAIKVHRTQARASIDVAGSAFTVTAERHEKASRSRWLVDGAEVKTWMLSRRALEPLFFPVGAG